MRRQQGFTLIELLVVIIIIGTMAVVLLPKVFTTRETANNMACKGNLRKIFGYLQAYKGRHRDMWPKESGVRFFLCVVQDPSIFERTPDNVSFFFCPSCRDDPNCNFRGIVDDPAEWLATLDDATSEDTSYAGRDMKHYGKGIGSSDLQVIVADDNEGGSNHKGNINYLTAGGEVGQVLYTTLVEKGFLETIEDEVPVGEDSPVKFKHCDLRKLVIE